MAEDKQWTVNDEAEQMVNDLVRQYHRHLDRAHIACLTKPKASVKHGKTVWATLQKTTPLMRALDIEADYVIVIGGPVWERLNTKERRALIDHELMHAAGYDDEAEAWTVAGHDIEEFSAIIQRHGAWRSDVERFLEVAQAVKLNQMTIDEAVKAHVDTMKGMGVTVEVGKAT